MAGMKNILLNKTSPHRDELPFSASWVVQAVLMYDQQQSICCDVGPIKAEATLNTPMLLVIAHVRGHRASRFPPATLNSTPKKTPTRRATRPVVIEVAF
jgi:hypothetical protein